MKSYLKSFLTWEAAGQFVKLAVIGVGNTVVFFAALNLFRRIGFDPEELRSAVSFAIATMVSYLLNRRWAFKIKTGWGSVNETVKFFIINGVALGVTVGFVSLAKALSDDDLTTFEENLANAVPTFLILLPKFASYRDLVFRQALRQEGRDPISRSAAKDDGAEPDAKGVASHLPQGSERHPA